MPLSAYTRPTVPPVRSLQFLQSTFLHLHLQQCLAHASALAKLPRPHLPSPLLSFPPHHHHPLRAPLLGVVAHTRCVFGTQDAMVSIPSRRRRRTTTNRRASAGPLALAHRHTRHHRPRPPLLSTHTTSTLRVLKTRTPSCSRTGVWTLTRPPSPTSVAARLRPPSVLHAARLLLTWSPTTSPSAWFGLLLRAQHASLASSPHVSPLPPRLLCLAPQPWQALPNSFLRSPFLLTTSGTRVARAPRPPSPRPRRHRCLRQLPHLPSPLEST